MRFLKTQRFAVITAVLAHFAASALHADDMTFAIIGDYGTGDSGDYEGKVAEMVFGWNPGFVLTVGDNNYEGNWNISDYDGTVGKFWCRFMYPRPRSDDDDHVRSKDWKGVDCASVDHSGGYTNFYPTPGNHDWSDDDEDDNESGYTGYQRYFRPLSSQGDYNSKTYYWFKRGPVNFYGINSPCLCDSSDNGGGQCGKDESDFRSWFNRRMSDSKAGERFNVVYFHHPPYNGGDHHPCSEMSFVWDAITTNGRQNNSLVVSGHQHQYERIMMDQNGTSKKVLFLVAGISGNRQDDCCTRAVTSPSNGSVEGAYCYNNHKGALKVVANSNSMQAQFYYRDTVNGVNTPFLLDTCTLSMNGPPSCSFSGNNSSHIEQCSVAR